MESNATTPSSEDKEDGAARSLGSYYGRRMSACQTLSLILNAGLMVYAHVGLSGVILSSQDPALTSIDDATEDVDVVVVVVVDAVDNVADENKNNATNAGNGNEVDDGPSSDRGLCANDADAAAWTANGGREARPDHSTYCSRQYKSANGNPCFLTSDCVAECFEVVYGYSAECAACFGPIPRCSLVVGCASQCAADGSGSPCLTCSASCVVDFESCAGFPDLDDGDEDGDDGNQTLGTNDTSSGTNDTNVTSGTNDTSATDSRNGTAAATSTSSRCREFDLDAIDTWYKVYDLTFVESVRDAWTGDAKLLACIVVVFSGIWPYLKNVLMLVVWFLPVSSPTRRTTVVSWLARLSKYTLVDVFAVVVVLVGVRLQLDVGGTEAVVRAEPRFGIVAFFLATLWEYLQIELIRVLHERTVTTGKATSSSSSSPTDDAVAVGFWVRPLLLAASIGLFVAGAATELVRFASFEIDGTESDAAGRSEDDGCVRSYNLVSLASALVNEMGLVDDASSASSWQTWVLCLAYAVTAVALPVAVHVLRAVSLSSRRRRSSSSTSLSTKTSLDASIVALACFSCVEVLLIGVFAVEHKFPQLVEKIAGESNAQFLDVSSGLGVGFYLLVAHSVAAAACARYVVRP